MNDENQKLNSNSFLSVLQRKELQESLLSDASAALGQLALAVKLAKKKGTLTLTLALEPQKGGALSVSAALNTKAPSTSPQSLTIFYVDQEGALVRDNPEQRELELTSHDGGQTDERHEQQQVESSAQA